MKLNLQDPTSVASRPDATSTVVRSPPVRHAPRARSPVASRRCCRLGGRANQAKAVQSPHLAGTSKSTAVPPCAVDPGFTSHILDLERGESDALLAYLYDHPVRPENTVGYHWSVGDVGFWDNRSTQHSVADDYGEQRRRVHRVRLRGDAPE
jgi:alpha-ketoglutarate-dependent taurine dioxygenase